MTAKHVHFMRLESPNGSPTVKGKCRSCRYVREYKSGAEGYIAPAEEGGKWRANMPRESFALADEVAE